MIIPDSQFDAAAQSVAQPDTDPLDRAASQVAGDQKVQLRASLYSSLMANPDMAARAQRLGRKTGLPGDVVERNLPEVERSAALNDIDRALERSPALAQWLADPKNARVAHDDVPQMGAIEAAVKWLVSAPDAPTTLVGTIKSGFFGASAGSAGAFQALAGTAAPLLDALEPVTSIGGNPLRRLQEGFGLIAQDSLASQKAARGKSVTWLGSAVDSGVESLAQNLGMLPMALLPGGQAAALTGMSAMAGGQTYTRDIQKGQGHWPALMHGASDAAIEAGTEMLPMARLIGDIKAGTPLFQTLLKNAALEVPGEQAATALQDLNDWAVNNNGRTFGDYLKERPEAAAQTLIATLVGVGGNVAIMKGVQGVADRAAGTERRAQLAEQHGQALADVSKLIEASKLRQRDPEAFATFAQSLTEEGVSSLYVDARALQQSGVDLQALAQALPSVAQQIEQAAATGGDVVIPTGEFLTQAPGQEWSAALIDHARTAADAMSPAGAREYMQAHGEQLQDEIAKTIEQHATDQEWQAGRDAVRSSFEAQLNEVGRFTPDVNRQYAALLGDYYAATAARAGMTPQELADRYPLRVQAKAAPGAVNAMEQ
ncbi:MAG TPA: hypothetical protein PLH47_11305, partial [Ottowia sp.]|nr:hypothetical protein [Ottowia sp.]